MEMKTTEEVGIAACMRLNAKLRKELDQYRWRPIAELHDDCGPCVLMNIDDPGSLEIGSNLYAGFNESQWTHFAEVPKLSIDDAARLIEEMNNHTKGDDTATNG
jgi:hypothetical protein